MYQITFRLIIIRIMAEGEYVSVEKHVCYFQLIKTFLFFKFGQIDCTRFVLLVKI